MKTSLPLLVTLASLLANVACASAPGESGTNSLVLGSGLVAPKGEAHIKVCLLGGYAIGGDGPATERACNRFTVSALPAKFDVPRPAELTDKEYALTATVYMGADETLSVGDYISDLVHGDTPDDLEGKALTLDRVGDCAKNEGGWCVTHRR